MRGGRLREVVAKGGSTVCPVGDHGTNLFLSRLGTSLAASPCLQRGMGLNAGGARFSPSARKLERFHRKTVQKGQFSF